MQIAATAKYVRISPEKVRLVVGQIKKMPPASAIKVLNFVPKKAASILKKVIASAIANAKNNYGLREDSLVFKEIQVGKGPGPNFILPIWAEFMNTSSKAFKPPFVPKATANP